MARQIVTWAGATVSTWTGRALITWEADRPTGRLISWREPAPERATEPITAWREPAAITGRDA